jgi:hypothetical protein
VLLGIAATVYFATRPDDKPPPPPPPTVTAVPEQPVAFTVEAESLLPAGGPSRDKVQVQSQDCCQGLQWSDGKQAWFTANAVGESMTLRFHVDRTGYYEMVAVMTKAIDYGTIELSIDGVDLATNFNGVNDGVITVEQNFAPNGLALTAGDHVLRVTTVQPSAIAGRVYAGIDKITFTPTQRIRRVDIDRIKVLTEENKILIKP